MNDTASRILAAIERADISYGTLSRITGIPKSALQRYASGQTKKIPIDRVELMASALNTTAAALLGWDPAGKTTEQRAAEDAAIIDAYHRASPEIRQAIQRILDDQ